MISGYHILKMMWKSLTIGNRIR